VAGSLADDVRRWAAEVATSGASCLEAKLRAKAPRDTGQLAGSISVTTTVRRATITVTARQDDSVAPHGPILNYADGKRIYPRRAKVLGPFQVNGRTMFARSVQQSTKHRGWWDNYPWQSEFDDCLRQAL